MTHASDAFIATGVLPTNSDISYLGDNLATIKTYFVSSNGLKFDGNKSVTLTEDVLSARLRDSV